MKIKTIGRYLIAFLVVCLLAGCAVAPPKKTMTGPPRNPCYDPVYVELSEKQIDTMSEREYQLFVEKERACSEFRQADMETAPERERNTILSLTLGAAGLIAAVALMIANGE